MVQGSIRLAQVWRILPLGPVPEPGSVTSGLGLKLLAAQIPVSLCYFSCHHGLPGLFWCPSALCTYPSSTWEATKVSLHTLMVLRSPSPDWVPVVLHSTSSVLRTGTRTDEEVCLGPCSIPKWPPVGWPLGWRTTCPLPHLMPTYGTPNTIFECRLSWRELQCHSGESVFLSKQESQWQRLTPAALLVWQLLWDPWLFGSL